MSTLNTPDREVIRKAKLLSSRTIRNSFSLMMGPSGSMAVKSHSVLNLNRRYQATSSPHERRRSLKASEPPFRLPHRYVPTHQVSRSFFLSVIGHIFLSPDPVPVVLIVVEGGPNTVRTGKSDPPGSPSSRDPSFSSSTRSRRSKQYPGCLHRRYRSLLQSIRQSATSLQRLPSKVWSGRGHLAVRG